MKGSERQALKIIGELGRCRTERIARKMAMSAEYADKLCENLLEDGYLSRAGAEEYMLSPRGKNAISRTLVHGQIAVLKGI